MVPHGEEQAAIIPEPLPEAPVVSAPVSVKVSARSQKKNQIVPGDYEAAMEVQHLEVDKIISKIKEKKTDSEKAQRTIEKQQEALWQVYESVQARKEQL